MTITAQQIRNYLASHPLRTQSGDFPSLLDALRDTYNEWNSVDSGAIRALFTRLDLILNKLPLKEQDDVIYTVCHLCSQYESEAFSHGILVGMNFMKELDEL